MTWWWKGERPREVRWTRLSTSARQHYLPQRQNTYSLLSAMHLTFEDSTVVHSGHGMGS